MVYAVLLVAVLLDASVFSSCQLVSAKQSYLGKAAGRSTSGANLTQAEPNEQSKALTIEEFQAQFLALTADMAEVKKLKASELPVLRSHFRVWSLAALSRAVPSKYEEERQSRLKKIASLENLVETDLRTDLRQEPAHDWHGLEGAFNHNNNERIREIWPPREDGRPQNCHLASTDLTKFDAGSSINDRCYQNLHDLFPNSANPYETLKHLCPRTCRSEAQQRCTECVNLIRFLLGPLFAFSMCGSAQDGIYLPQPCTDCYMQLLITCEVATLTPGVPDNSEHAGPSCRVCNQDLMTGCALKLLEHDEVVCALGHALNSKEKCARHGLEHTGEETYWCPVEVVVKGNEYLPGTEDK